jgi:hypothetical protein
MSNTNASNNTSPGTQASQPGGASGAPKYKVGDEISGGYKYDSFTGTITRIRKYQYEIEYWNGAYDWFDIDLVDQYSVLQTSSSLAGTSTQHASPAATLSGGINPPSSRTATETEDTCNRYWGYETKVQPKCTCGADTTYGENSAPEFHSTWMKCPKAKENK